MQTRWSKNVKDTFHVCIFSLDLQFEAKLFQTRAASTSRDRIPCMQLEIQKLEHDSNMCTLALACRRGGVEKQLDRGTKQKLTYSHRRLAK